MDQLDSANITGSRPFLNKLKEKLYRWTRLTNRPVVKVYNGYGNADEIVVFGHVLSLSPLPRKKFRRNVWTNTLALLRLFMIRPISFAKVECHFNGEVILGSAEKDGFFRFQFKPLQQLPPGNYPVEVFLDSQLVKRYYGAIGGTGEVRVPHPGAYAFISDIDDTFLISYSTNLWKRLYILLTENAYSRKPFDGVVRHYQALEHAGENVIEPHPFFYVSSSEWNLYDYIRDFSRKNVLPKGVFLLSQMKTFSQLWKTGQQNHGTKFIRISRIIQAFPDRQFILLGDNSQQDPVIYASIVDYFPRQIKAVYLRDVYQKNHDAVQAAIEKMESAGIPVCHFRHSRDAITHSRSIGLISTT